MGSSAFRQRHSRLLVGSMLCSWALITLLGTAASRAQSPTRLTVDIPPQPLAAALAAYARQTGLQVLYVSEIVRKKASKGARAGVTPDAALTQLLAGTGLRFEFLNERSVRIVVAKPTPPSGPAPQKDDHQGGESLTSIEEILVTAAQRDEPQSLVPISMGVWTPQAIDMAGAKYFGAIADLTPGVEFDSYPDYGAGIETNIAIRGVNSKDGSTTGDLHRRHTDSDGSGQQLRSRVPDALRPQADRGTAGPSGRVVWRRCRRGSGPIHHRATGTVVLQRLCQWRSCCDSRSATSYEVGAAGGGPVSSGVAGLRLGGWLRHDGGFVDRVDPYTGAIVDKNANWMRSEAGNAAVTIVPNESLQITPSFRYQATDINDTSAFFLSLSDPAHGVLRNGSGLAQYYSDRFSLASLKIAAALGFADLSSVTAYIQRDASALEDNATLDGLNQSGYAAAKGDPVWLDQTVLSQELRLASSDQAARLRWIVGASYVHAHYEENQDIATSALADGGALTGRQQVDRLRSQLGAYVELDLRLRQRLTASVGVRVERDSYDSFQQVDPFPPVVGEQDFSINGAATPVTPRFNLTYQADAGSLYYATVAKGYRMGGPNNTVGVACPVGTPLTYRPDYVWSYEIGAKNTLLGGHLQVDSSVFYIAWQDMQIPIPLTNCGFSFTVNAGAATSKGFDLGLQAAVSDISSSLSLRPIPMPTTMRP